jgi:glycosyltransferase involved in cell wall biosynthesis
VEVDNLAAVAPGDGVTVAAIIPCFNSAGLVQHAVESVLRQSHAVSEIVVIDDGSTDNLDDVMARFAEPVRLIRQLNQGPAAARNNGIESTRAEFIAFLDADDLWHSRKVERQLAALRQSPESGLSHTQVRYIDAQGLPTPPWPGWRERARASGSCLDDLVRRNSMTISSVMVRRSTLGAHRFDTAADVRGCDDWDLWLRLAAETSVAFVDEELTDYRIHQSMSNSAMLMTRSAIGALDRAIARPWPATTLALAAEHRAELAAALGHVYYEAAEYGLARYWYRQAWHRAGRFEAVRYLRSWFEEGRRKLAGSGGSDEAV